MVLRILLLALALPPLEGSRESPAQEPEAAALLQLQGDGVQFTDEFTSCPPVPKITCHKQHGVQMSGPTFAMKQMFKSMPDQGLSPVKCPVCNTPGAQGHLYSVERYDGLGQRAAHLLLTIATARHLNLNFGGLLPSPDSGVHGADVSTCLGALIGSNYGAVIRKVRHPQFDACVFGKEALLSKPSLTDSRDVFFHECMFKNQPHQFLTPAFLAELRKKSHVLKHPTPFFRKKRRFHVAVHVRRGDIMEQRTRSKPDQDYLSAVQAVLDLLPPGTSDVHVFSTTSEGKFSTKSFDAYRSRRMYVHLNGDEMTDWAHMAQADVLVQAPSSFSWVAGVLNPNCVVGFSTFPDRLPQWIVHNNGKFKGRDRERLRKCLSKLRSH